MKLVDDAKPPNAPYEMSEERHTIKMQKQRAVRSMKKRQNQEEDSEASPSSVQPPGPSATKAAAGLLGAHTTNDLFKAAAQASCPMQESTHSFLDTLLTESQAHAAAPAGTPLLTVSDGEWEELISGLHVEGFPYDDYI